MSATTRARAARASLALACTLALLAVAACTLALLAVAACTRPQPHVVTPPVTTPGTAPTSTPTTPTPAAPTTPTAPADGVPLDQLTVSLDRVAGGFDQPLYVTGAGDGSGRLFVVEQAGLIKVVRNGKVQPRPYLDISARVLSGGERGLLGLAFAPDFSKSGRFYVDYTDSSGNTVIARFTADDPTSDTPSISGPRKMLGIDQPYPNHNGGCVQFGPDGMLWIGMGDGGSAGDPHNRAQNPLELLGKLLRIDVSKSAGGKPYAIPQDNPRGKFAPEVWAYGLRNPWRFSFDRSNGRLWIGDVGQNAWEEIDTASGNAAGLNYGWRLYEGTHAYDPASPPASKSGLTFPIAEYSHSTGYSVTGGYVYRGVRYPALAGTYLYADYGHGQLWGLRRRSSGAASNRQLLATGLSVSSFGEDDQGELYLTDLAGGGVYRITAK